MNAEAIGIIIVVQIMLRAQIGYNNDGSNAEKVRKAAAKKADLEQKERSLWRAL